MWTISRASVALIIAMGISSPAVADDWTAVKLRGLVFGLFDGEWVRLQRGDVIPDDQGIRTLTSGRVTFQRGNETIELGPDSQIQIVDRAGHGKYTTVKQHFGKVAVEAEVKEVQHFAVQTPYLAAVVKGTRFVVVSGSDGAVVDVERGAVAVRDPATHQSTVVSAGQQAGASPDTGMWVDGEGDLPPILGPDGTVSSSKGKESQQRAGGEGGDSSRSADRGGNSGGNGGGNNGGGNSGNGGGNNGGGNSGNGGGNSGGENGGGNSGGGNGGGNSGGGNGGGNSGNGGGNGGNSGKPG